MGFWNLLWWDTEERTCVSFTLEQSYLIGTVLALVTSHTIQNSTYSQWSCWDPNFLTRTSLKKIFFLSCSEKKYVCQVPFTTSKRPRFLLISRTFVRSQRCASYLGIFFSILITDWLSCLNIFAMVITMITGTKKSAQLLTSEYERRAMASSVQCSTSGLSFPHEMLFYTGISHLSYPMQQCGR